MERFIKVVINLNYNQMKDISDKIIELYNKIALDNNINIYNYSAPHRANFDKLDKVISIMGINPSVDGNNREITYNKGYDKETFSKTNNTNLDLFYIPEYKNLTEDIKKKIGDKYICKFANKPYNLVCGDETLPFKKFLKLPWQKYDEKFIRETYGDEKLKEYIELINSIKNQYNMDLFEDKYLIFTNLLYVSDYNQNNISKILEDDNYSDKFVELINKLINAQLEYYNIQLLIVANSYASKYLRKYILTNERNWTKSDKSIHAYKNTKTNRIVYLTARYYDRMDTFSRELFYEDIGKII